MARERRPKRIHEVIELLERGRRARIERRRRLEHEVFGVQAQVTLVVAAAEAEREALDVREQDTGLDEEYEGVGLRRDVCEERALVVRPLAFGDVDGDL